MSKFCLYYELLIIIERQEQTICDLNKTICQLVNENLEKENMIEVLMEEHIQEDGGALWKE